eukprot:TRINITY_DN13305_c0_g2_i2.p1 TRINITY_DN13305_c0_g2~~TRINITY_DN13305_c0_g2_i2.p1  ORF type:complete len:291 (-),score=70.10 TRINITY_DN13305_c0_g2_i2:70-942(-)
MYCNINQYALLDPSEAPRRESNTKNEPHVFLQYLFDIFSSEAKTIIEKQNKKVEYIQDVMNALKKNLNASLYTAAKQAVLQLRGRGELKESKAAEVSNSAFSSFLTSLSKKCDFSELQFMNDLKANKVDLDSVKSIATQTSERLKHFVVLTNQFMLLLTSSSKELKAERTSGLAYIVHQMALLHKSMSQSECREEQKMQPGIFIGSPAKERLKPETQVSLSEGRKSTRRHNILRFYEGFAREHHRSSSHKAYYTNAQRNKFAAALIASSKYVSSSNANATKSKQKLSDYS